MRLLQRVAALIRANINELLERAEDPESMIKQLTLDLNNQLIQVKTTVAQALADQHLLERRVAKTREEAGNYERKALEAVERGDDRAARLALERYNSCMATAEESELQLAEQKKEVESLKQALGQLETKIAEITRQRDVLLARERRAFAKEKLLQSKNQLRPERLEQLLDAISGHVEQAEAHAQAYEEVHGDGASRSLLKMEEDARIEAQLEALKAKHPKGDGAS